jgi:hypothetical protein
MIHTFLQNAKLDSSFSLSDVFIVLNQFINFFLRNSSVAVTGHLLHRLSHKSALPGSILVLDQ